MDCWLHLFDNEHHNVQFGFNVAGRALCKCLIHSASFTGWAILTLWILCGGLPTAPQCLPPVPGLLWSCDLKMATSDCTSYHSGRHWDVLCWCLYQERWGKKRETWPMGCIFIKFIKYITWRLQHLPWCLAEVPMCVPKATYCSQSGATRADIGWIWYPVLCLGATLHGFHSYYVSCFSNRGLINTDIDHWDSSMLFHLVEDVLFPQITI